MNNNDQVSKKYIEQFGIIFRRSSALTNDAYFKINNSCKRICPLSDICTKKIKGADISLGSVCIDINYEEELFYHKNFAYIPTLKYRKNERDDIQV